MCKQWIEDGFVVDLEEANGAFFVHVSVTKPRIKAMREFLLNDVLDYCGGLVFSYTKNRRFAELMYGKLIDEYEGYGVYQWDLKQLL